MSDIYIVIPLIDRVKLGMPVRSISEENGVITVETENGQMFKVRLSFTHVPLYFSKVPEAFKFHSYFDIDITHVIKFSLKDYQNLIMISTLTYLPM